MVKRKRKYFLFWKIEMNTSEKLKGQIKYFDWIKMSTAKNDQDNCSVNLLLFIKQTINYIKRLFNFAPLKKEGYGME